MARIRTIKPEFPQSESVGKLSRDARLLFVLIWTHVDDEGRSRAASRMLASLLFPYDDDAPKLVGHWLDELEENGFIQRYDVEGARYLQVVNWTKHQKIDHPSKSKIPPFSEGGGKARDDLAKPRETSRSLAPDLGPRTRDLGVDIPSPVGDGRQAATMGEPEILDPLPLDPEARLFDSGKALLGKGAGGQIAKLLRAHRGDVAAAQERIDRAARAQDPGEFIAGCIRASTGPPPRISPHRQAMTNIREELDRVRAH